MNICLATSTFPADPGDSSHAAFLLDVMRVLEQHGHRVSVLTQARVDAPVVPFPGADVVWFPWRRLGNRLAEVSFGSLGGVRSAASLIVMGTREVRKMRRTRRIDVFICAWIIPSGLYVYLDQVLGRSRTPYVLWALGSDVSKYRSNPLVAAALRRVAARAGAIYADGFRLCDEVRSITRKRCEFLPTFRTLPRPERAGRHALHVPPRFLYVGRHTPVKGVDVLIDAVVALKAHGDPAYQLDIVGDGDLRPDLERTIAAAGLGHRVRFRPRLSDQELADAYSACDCVVIPSRSESIPLVMSEALQHGRPLIVTNVGDMGDLVRKYGLGVVVPKENPLALADAMRGFIAAPVLLDEARAAELLVDLTFESAAPAFIRRLEELVTA